MGRRFYDHENGSKIYSCKDCRLYLTNRNELCSTQFRGSTGAAYLFHNVWNITVSDAQVRTMMTGDHIVRDVMCVRCGKKLGWMYEFAMEDSQLYKESKVILEKALIESEEGILDPEQAERSLRGQVEPDPEVENAIETFHPLTL